ncbi:hypothetical protein DCM78_27695 [Bradyrhizobium sp. WBOS04]|nr:hypothetical protein DCM78_27695 [Bradyrhizobium sp. WBOS04]UUO57735.1 hypothetical protein DCM80_00195 [Bradyrhizobium sp. WBOS08]
MGPGSAAHRTGRCFASPGTLRCVRGTRASWSSHHHCHSPRRRGIQYAAASRIDLWRLWNTGSPAFAGDDSACTSRSPLLVEPGWTTHTSKPNFGKVEYF